MTIVPVEEYFHTTYDPDCDHIEGPLLKRNVGEIDHGDAQSSGARAFYD